MSNTPTPTTPENDHDHPTIGGRCASDCSLSALVAEWDIAVAKKWREVRKAKGTILYIYRPQISHSEDMRKRRETSREVATWTEQWFRERGHQIEAVIMDDGESIGLCEANAIGEARADNATSPKPPTQ